MRNTTIIAKIKKIDNKNKVVGENWHQSISILLDDIELTNENLIAIRQFRPDEDIRVKLNRLQMTFEELEERKKLRRFFTGKVKDSKKDEEVEEVKEDDQEDIENLDEDEEEEFFTLTYDDEIPDTDKVLKTFDFSDI